MRYFIILLTFFLTSGICFAKHLHKESVYQKYWCSAHSGITEYKLDDFTRVDCLTETQAVEFDFANKWAECIGQALHYGIITDRVPACVLIMERGSKDDKYLKRLKGVADKTGIKVYTITPDDLTAPF